MLSVLLASEYLYLRAHVPSLLLPALRADVHHDMHWMRSMQRVQVRICNGWKPRVLAELAGAARHKRRGDWTRCAPEVVAQLVAQLRRQHAVLHERIELVHGARELVAPLALRAENR